MTIMNTFPNIMGACIALWGAGSVAEFSLVALVLDVASVFPDDMLAVLITQIFKNMTVVQSSTTEAGAAPATATTAAPASTNGAMCQVRVNHWSNGRLKLPALGPGQDEMQLQ